MSSEKTPEQSLREYCIEPGDLDENPWSAFCDAVYQRYGAGFEAHEFSDYLGEHCEEWFLVVARMVVHRDIVAWLRGLEAEYDARSGGVEGMSVDYGMLRASVHMANALAHRIESGDYPKLPRKP